MSAETTGVRRKRESTESEGVRANSSAISKDDVFEVLSNRRRRYAIHYLQRHEEAVGLGELSETVAAWENDVPPEQISSSERKRVYTALQQFHLPKMERKGLVEYDQRGGVVEPTETTNAVDVYLDVVPEDDIPWSHYYLGLSAMSAVLLGLVWLDVPPTTVLPDAAWLALVVLAFAVSSLVHAYRDREMRLGSEESPPAGGVE